MADFVAVLKKTLDGLTDTSPPMRERVYEKARLTISGKLAAMNPPPSTAAVDRQKRALEDAIAQIERGYGVAGKSVSDPLAELESVFASLKNPTVPLTRVDPQKPAPPRPAPVVAEARTIAPMAPSPMSPTPRAAAPQPARPVVEAPSIVPQPLPENPFQVSADEDSASIAEEPEERRSRTGLIVALLALLVIAGGGYAAWMNRSELMQVVASLIPSLAGKPAGKAPGSTQPAETNLLPPARPSTPAPQTAPDTAATAPAGAPADQALTKFTQRLNADGSETDAGPASGTATIGEGTSVASVTQPVEPVMPPSAVPEANAPAAADAVPAAEQPAAEQPAAEQPAAEQPAEGQPADAGPVNPPAEASAPPPSDDEEAGLPPPPVSNTPLPPIPSDLDGSSTAPADAQATATPPADVASPPAASTEQPATPPVAVAPEAIPEAAPPSADAPAAAPSTTATTAPDSVPVGQRAIFYEERTNVSPASAEPGSIVWSLVKESPGGDAPPEPAIRAEATIPGKDVQLRLTIRRNTDPTLPASHIVEVIFLTPPNFEGGGIDNVLRISMKKSEQEAGSPLIGIPAKIADGFFLVALNDSKPEIDANLALLRGESWIDVPVQYKSGRRALFTMEKGIPGTKIFDEAIKAWQGGSG